MNKFSLCIISVISIWLTGLAEAQQLTNWARLDSKNAVRVVNRLGYVEDNFANGKPEKTTDQVVIDFMGYAGKKTSGADSQKSAKQVKFTGLFLLGKEHAKFNFKGAATVKSPTQLDYTVELDSAKPQQVKELYFSILLNRPMLDREINFTIKPANGRIYFKKIKVASSHKGGWIWSSPKEQMVQAISIPMIHGKLQLSGFVRSVMLCKWSKSRANIRIYFESGKVKSLKQTLKIKYIPFKNTK